MADSKITALPAATSVAETDLVPVVTDPGGAATNKAATVAAVVDTRVPRVGAGTFTVGTPSSFVSGYIHSTGGTLSSGASAMGAFVQGRVRNGATLTATKDGSSVHGAACRGLMTTLAAGAEAHGYIYGNTGSTPVISATGEGGEASGAAFGGSSATIVCSEDGAFARGYVYAYNGYVSRIKAGSRGSFASGYATSDTSSSALIEALGKGAFAQGYAEHGTISVTASGARAQGYVGFHGLGQITSTGKGASASGAVVDEALITATGKGCFAHGYAMGFSNSSPGCGAPEIRASDYGATAIGFTMGGSGAAIRASQGGATAIGYAYAKVGNVGNLTASGHGAFATGSVANSSGSSTTGLIEATGIGAFARGYVVRGSVSASGTASSAQGYVKVSGTISATAKGSFACGYANATTIEATAVGAVQFAVGTNALAHSLQVGTTGTGVRLCSAGAPGTPANGDIWTAGGYVYIRSNGASKKIT